MENNLENNYVNTTNLEEPMTVGNWICTQLLMMIPIVNIVLMFVWAFGNTKCRSKKTFFQASLILTGIIVCLYVLLFVVLFSAL